VVKLIEILRVELRSLEAKRSAEISELRNIGVKVEVANDIRSFEKCEEGYLVKVNVRANYPGIGYVIADAHVYLRGADQEFQEWKKTGKLPPTIVETSLNAVSSSVLVDMIVVSRMLALPPPIPLPRFSVSKGGEPGSGQNIGVI